MEVEGFGKVTKVDKKCISDVGNRNGRPGPDPGKIGR